VDWRWSPHGKGRGRDHCCTVGGPVTYEFGWHIGGKIVSSKTLPQECSQETDPECLRHCIFIVQILLFPGSPQRLAILAEVFMAFLSHSHKGQNSCSNWRTAAFFHVHANSLFADAIRRNSSNEFNFCPTGSSLNKLQKKEEEENTGLSYSYPIFLVCSLRRGLN
jgi:hypothetical protein